MRERAHLDVHPDQAAQAGRERRDADVPVSRVGDDDDVRGQPVAVLAQQIGEGLGGDLLLALDEEPHGDRQVIAQGAERAHVHRDPRLVVGRAPAVEARRRGRWARTAGCPSRPGRSPAGHRGARKAGRPERPRVPSARRSRPAGRRHRPGRSRPRRPQRPAAGPSSCADSSTSPRRSRVGADGLDPDESLEVADQAGQEIMDTVLQVAHRGNSTIARSGARRRRGPAAGARAARGADRLLEPRVRSG